MGMKQGYYKINDSDGKIEGCNQTDGCQKKDSCQAITISDSNYAFNPIHGSLNDTKSIICNDGYSFNHDLLHQGGKIQCNYDVNNFWDNVQPKRNKMSWYVYNHLFDEKCNNIKTEEECNSLLYNKDNKGNENQEVRCIWDNNAYPSPACLFRHKVDQNDIREPICKPLLCPEKNIPYSNKSIDPLPGPENSNIKGKCINEDTGETYDFIDNSSDCMCYIYNTCKQCADNDSCQWCSDPKGNGNCFSKRSKNPLCKNKSQSTNNKPVCKNIDNKATKKYKTLLDGWDGKASSCEEKKCFKPDNSNLNGYDFKDIDVLKKRQLIRSISTEYQRDEDICMAYNNTWGISPHKDVNEDHNKSTCTYKNKYIEKFDWTTKFREFGLLNNKISIDSHYCVPLSKTDTNSKCYGKSINECSNDDSCELTENLFNDKDIKWTSSTNNYSDIIHIGKRKDTKTECYYNSKTYTLSGEKGAEFKKLAADKPHEFKVTNVGDGNIDISTMDDKKVTIDKTALKGCGIQYINTEDYSINNINNADNNLFINTVKDNISPKECINGKLVCKVKPGKTCGVNYSSPINNMCSYNTPTCNGKPKFCKRGENVDEINEKNDTYASYTYKNTMDELQCNNTDYKYKHMNSSLNKNIGFCEATKGETTNEKKCNTLNKRYVDPDGNNIDTVHFGKYCSYDTYSPEISLKRVCENKGGEFIDDNCYIDKEITPPSCPTDVNSKGFHLKPSTYKKCLVELPAVETDSTLLSVDICEKWSSEKLKSRNFNYIPDINFEYTRVIEDNKDKPKLTKKCHIGELADKPSPIPSNKKDCEKDNHNWGVIYEYIDNNTCLNNNVEVVKNLNWTGGNIQNVNGDWGSTCSSSIMSSCNVNCDSGYSGGGMYYCHYNDEAKDVCAKINKEMNEKKNYPTKKKRKMCETYLNCSFSESPSPSCLYISRDKGCKDLEKKMNGINNIPSRKKICEENGKCLYSEPSTCSPINVKGSPEWLGHRCYTTNNDLFERGTGTIKTLYSSVVNRPLIILLLYSLVAIFIIILLYKIDALNIIWCLISRAIKRKGAYTDRVGKCINPPEKSKKSE